MAFTLDQSYCHIQLSPGLPMKSNPSSSSPRAPVRTMNLSSSCSSPCKSQRMPAPQLRSTVPLPLSFPYASTAQSGSLLHQRTGWRAGGSRAITISSNHGNFLPVYNGRKSYTNPLYRGLGLIQLLSKETNLLAEVIWWQFTWFRYCEAWRKIVKMCWKLDGKTREILNYKISLEKAI